MVFPPKTWKAGESGGTPITAAELNRIEQGIAAADRVTADEVEGLQAKLDGKADVKNVPAAWRNAVARRYGKPLTIAYFGDSRGDGFRNDPEPDGISDFDNTPIGIVGSILRSRLGLFANGCIWHPASMAGTQDQYNFPTPTNPATGGKPDSDITWSTGVSGAQYIEPNKTVRVPLDAACTSIEAWGASTFGGWQIMATGESGVTNSAAYNVNEVGSVKLENPGLYVDVSTTLTGTSGASFFGLFEYRNDERIGVRVVNLAVPGTNAVDCATWLDMDGAKSLFAALDFDAVVVEFGANDVGQHTPAAVKAAVNKFCSTAPVSVVVTTPQNVQGSTNDAPAWKAMNDALRASDATYIADVTELAPKFDAPVWAGCVLADGTHLTEAGAAAYADVIAAVLP